MAMTRSSAFRDRSHDVLVDPEPPKEDDGGCRIGNSFAVIVPKEKKNETGLKEEEDDGALGEEHTKEVFSFSIAAAWANY
ncbi:hypothetical protein RUM43_009940 [Polyplax serrata]|uniref:Uncharacterized protein n=1 Tax=Polyplax serrata TaxID=468196 RepID=A0AAN8S6Y9_POLSC